MGCSVASAVAVTCPKDVALRQPQPARDVTGARLARTGRRLDKSSWMTAAAARAKRKSIAAVHGSHPLSRHAVKGFPAFMERRFEDSGSLCFPKTAPGSSDSMPPCPAPALARQ